MKERKKTEYEDFVEDLTSHPLGKVCFGELHMVLGLVTEVGELSDAYKKTIGYRQQLDDDNIIEEMGDILFYLTGLCLTLGTDVEELAKENMRKLKKRYPDGFNEEDAVDRKDKKDGE